MFRAKRKDGKGEVKGDLIRSSVAGSCFIMTQMSTYYKGLEKRIANMTYHEVIPSTIAIKTGQLDNLEKYIANGCDILEIEEKKMVMDEWYDKLIEIRRKGE